MSTRQSNDSKGLSAKRNGQKTAVYYLKGKSFCGI